MLLTSFDPFLQEFDRLSREALGRNTGGAVMPLDVIRHPDDVELRFDLPGIDPDSIDVTVDRGVLTVSATREEKLAEEDRHYVRERVMGSFSRRVHLPDHLDSGTVSADYHDGVLTVRIALHERSKPRKIAIGRGGRKAIKG